LKKFLQQQNKLFNDIIKPMKTLLIVFFMFLLHNLVGQTTSPQNNVPSIDDELKACLDSTENYTTAGMTGCFATATVKWDKLLNQNYKKLLSLLSDEGKVKLRESQRKWIEFRDKELEFSHELYGSELEGTMWIPVAASINMELTKQRALEIEKYISDLEAGKL
jgi:uncharacterized protein YecT (DUF1311 family)